MDNNELMHYGRKGMKWYQNIFTKKKSSGKKSDQDDDDNQEQKPKSSSQSSKPKQKSVKEMSNAELREAMNRLQDEARYKQMLAADKSKGAKFINTVANDVIKPAVINAGRNAVQDFATKKIKDVMGLNKTSELDKIKRMNDAMRTKKENAELNKWWEEEKRRREKDD
jgi:hypothetical protein